MLEKIITGGQTGADQAAWRAAADFGVLTGGSMPRGFLTADGPRPEFAAQFRAVELPTGSRPARTEQNVRDADGTLWFGETTTTGANETMVACRRWGKPCLLLYPAAEFTPAHAAEWIKEHNIRMLNVAGNREQDEPGIGGRVEQFLSHVLRLLGHAE
jgi:hypothetical protein